MEPRKVRIFCGSSHELANERKALKQVVDELNKNEAVARNVNLELFLWESDAIGAGAKDINEAIQRSADYKNIDLVIILFWNKIGDGTIDEYKKAVIGFRNFGKPNDVFVYFKTPTDETDVQTIEKIQHCKQKMIDDDHIAPNHFDTTNKFRETVRKHLLDFLKGEPNVKKIPIRDAKKKYNISCLMTFIFSFFLLFLSRKVSMPDNNVNEFTIFTILFLPPLIAISYGVMMFYFLRFISQFRRIWHSFDWKNETLYDLYRNIIPPFRLPPQLKKLYSKGPFHTVLSLFVLMVLWFAPVYCQYTGLFDEITEWPVVVAPGTTKTQQGKSPNALLKSKYVEQGYKTWFFGLQEEENIAEYRKSPSPIIFVYAEKKFKGEHPGQYNSGPQVFIPCQPWIYLVLMIVCFYLGLYSFYRIFTIDRELRRSY